MPELPEVENMMRALLVCKNNSINNIYSSHKKLRKDIPSNLPELINNTQINHIYRKAKYIVFNLSNNNSIIMHAGMSGNFFLEPYSKNIQKHDHIILYLNSQQIIRYNDPRRFGLFIVIPTSDVDTIYFKNIGPDAVSNSFNTPYFQDKVKHIKSNIKNTLLKQEIVAGIGNIYASESLFYSQINPQLPANSLSQKEVTTLIFHIKNILNNSIESGGSTLKDYRKPNGSKGGFQNQFAVYALEGTKCVNKLCNGNIVKIVQNGRSTFYCNMCQN